MPDFLVVHQNKDVVKCFQLCCLINVIPDFLFYVIVFRQAAKNHKIPIAFLVSVATSAAAKQYDFRLSIVPRHNVFNRGNNKTGTLINL